MYSYKQKQDLLMNRQLRGNGGHIDTRNHRRSNRGAGGHLPLSLVEVALLGLPKTQSVFL